MSCYITLYYNYIVWIRNRKFCIYYALLHYIVLCEQEAERVFKITIHYITLQWVNEKQKEFSCDAMQLLYYQAPLSAIFVAIVIPFFEPVIQEGGIFGTNWSLPAIVSNVRSPLQAFSLQSLNFVNKSEMWQDCTEMWLEFKSRYGYRHFWCLIASYRLLSHRLLSVSGTKHHLQMVWLAFHKSGLYLHFHILWW